MDVAEETREYKDRLFCYIFGSPEHRDWTLSLYNAVNGSNYTDPEQITIATLTQVVYMGMHNDVAFLIADEVNLYEQQSTYNPNMPLRLMQYTGNIYEKLITLQRRNKYGKTLIPLPVPKLVVFYNGTAEMPDETTLELSDAFPVEKRGEADIAVRVRMININKGKSPSLVTACQPLNEYTWLVDAIRQNERTLEPGAAIDAALDAMPRHFMLRPWLEANRVEVKKMLLTEYNETETMLLFKEEGRQEGRAEGKQEEESRQSTLTQKLIALGRTDDALKAALDPAYKNTLYREFGMA